MIKKTWFFSFLCFFCSNLLAQDLSKKELETIEKSWGIESLVKGKFFEDKNGKHFLVFSKKYSSIPDYNGGEKIDIINLSIKQLIEVNNKKIIEWSMSDKVECSVVDFSADFIDGAIQIVDLFGENEKSVVVAYTTFCGGGVDPKTMKVIYKNTKEKIALRGETLLEYGGSSYGGIYNEDAVFKKSNIKIKKLLRETWEKHRKQ